MHDVGFDDSTLVTFTLHTCMNSPESITQGKILFAFLGRIENLLIERTNTAPALILSYLRRYTLLHDCVILKAS